MKSYFTLSYPGMELMQFKHYLRQINPFGLSLICCKLTVSSTCQLLSSVTEAGPNLNTIYPTQTLTCRLPSGSDRNTFVEKLLVCRHHGVLIYSCVLPKEPSPKRKEGGTFLIFMEMIWESFSDDAHGSQWVPCKRRQ